MPIKASFAAGSYFESGVAKASIALEKSDIARATVEAVNLPDGYPYSTKFMWGGDETSSPKKIIKTVTVLRSGQTIFIPLSAYADLGNPRKIILQKTSSQNFQLIILGGDAAGSYKAMLDFRKDEIFRRKVISGEFPKEVWEETTYSFNHLNN